jgi:S1-C subfamily serine protease
MSEVLCRCPACSVRFKVDAKYAGKKARCPKCSTIVEVPAPGADSLTGTSIPATPSAPVSVPPPPVGAQTVNRPFPPKPTPVPGQLHSAGAKAAPGSRALPPRPIPPPPPPDLALNAVAEAPPPPPSNDFGFQINTGSQSSPAGAGGFAPLNSQPSSSPRANAPGAKPGKKKDGSKSPLFILAAVGGVLLLAALAAGGFMIMSNMRSGTVVAKHDGKRTKSSSSSAPKGSGTLVVDMSEDDRKEGFAIIIDGRREPSLRTGELSFSLGAGDHKLLLQRRGYEPVETTISIAAGEVETFKPEWRKNETATPNSSFATTSLRPNTSSGGTNFEIGTATGSPVQGFDGFIQNFSLAKANAVKTQKNVLIIFGSTDANPTTMELSRLVQQPKIKDLIMASFVPVIIDFPRGQFARNNVWDSLQNKSLFEEYHLQSLPVVLLIDPQGKPFSILTDFSRKPIELEEFLTEGIAARSERDKLWGEAKGDALDSIVTFVNWLTDKRIVGSYEKELEPWLAVAKRLDADNEKAQYECVLEAYMRARSGNIDFDDQIDAKRFVDLLSDWLTDKRFKDEDRGARLHLMAGGVLARHNLRELAMRHLNRAQSYSPTDDRLKEALAQVKIVIERGNILSNGTGFVVSDAGYIMTNHHVIDGPGKVMVRLADNKTLVEGKVIASDSKRDIAIVKIDVPDDVQLTTLPVNPEPIGRGIDVAAFGYPLAGSVGASLKFTKGGVSALPDDTNEQMIMLDLRVNPGNSGGPLCDQRGNVVGMVSAKTRANMFTNEDSLGLAIPSSDLVAFMEKFLPNGTTVPAPHTGERREWSEVDAQVSPGVLLILKMEQ